MRTSLARFAAIVAFVANALAAHGQPTVFTVTNTNVSGPGSLAGILAAMNPSACPAGGTRVEFNIPAATDPGCDATSGICKLQMPDAAFMQCSDLVIDGYTQPGASPNTATDYTNNAQLRIELDNGGANAASLRTQGEYNLFGYNGVQNVTVRGLALPRHTLELPTGNTGSNIHGGSGRVVAGNWFGWHADGTMATGAVSKGVFLFGSYLSNVVVGGAAPADRNLFTHRVYAVCCEVGSRGIYGEGIQGAVIEGNYFNVSPSGQPVATNGIFGGIILTGGLSSGAPYSRDVAIRNNAMVNLAGGMGLGMAQGMGLSRNVVTGLPLGQQAWTWFTVPAGGLRNEDRPVITGVTELPGEMRVFGTVANAANATMRLEFFHNTQGGFQGGTQAERFVGEMEITLDSGGNGSFVASLPADTRNVSVSSTNLATGETGYLAGSDGVPQVFRLDIARSGTGLGTVSVGDPSTLDCTGTCTKLLAVNSVVTLTAAAQPGSQFVGWSGACSGMAPCTLTMSSDRAVTANYIGGSGPPVIGNAPLSADATSGVGYSFTYSVTGAAPYTWSLDPNCTLPAGLSLDPATGTIAGTPGPLAERIECVVRVSNGIAPDATQVYELRANVTAGTPQFTFNTMPSGPTGASYAQPLPVQGTAPLAIQLLAGTLPPGLALSGTDLVGTPTVAGTYTFILRASGPDGTASRPFTMVVGQGIAPLVTSAAPPNGSEFTAYSHTFVASGTSPIAWSVVSGTLPPGLALDAATGVLSGTPTFDGAFNFTVQAANGTPPAGTQVVAMNIATNSRTLNIARSGTGTGRVVSAPAGIDCGSACSAHFPTGAAVSLQATADADSTFASWTNCPSASGATCAVALSTSRTVTATFAKKKVTLTANVVGGGTVGSSPAGISCQSGCTSDAADFDLGTVVTLTAFASPTRRFEGWTGACSGAASTCIVTMDAAKSVTATYVQQFLLSVANFGSPSTGKVTGTPAGIDCPGTCGVFYDPGTVVTLTATPDAGSVFAGWSNACTGTGTCTVTVNGHTSVNATFAPFVAPTAVLTLNVTSPAPVGFTSEPAGLTCTQVAQGATCTGTFPAGTNVRLTPVPSRIQFYPLGTCEANQPVCTIAMNGTRTFAIDSTVNAALYRTVRIISSGQDTVNVASMAAATPCSAASCELKFLATDQLAITAAPGANRLFLGWETASHPSGVGLALPACNVGTPSCNLTLADAAFGTNTQPKGLFLLPRFSAKPVLVEGVSIQGSHPLTRSTRVATVFTPAPVVRAIDAQGHPVVGARFTFTVAPGSNGAGALRAEPQVAYSGADGLASASYVANGIAGGWSLVVKAETGGTPVTAVFVMSNTNDVVPVRLPGSTGVATMPASSLAGIMLSVRVTTPNGTKVPNARVVFSAPASPNTLGVPVPSGSFVPPSVQSDANGIARTRLVANGVPGSFVVTVRVTPPAGITLRGGAAAGFEGEDYVSELLVEAQDLPDAVTLDPNGDVDGDGIPNAVEDAEGTLAYDKDNEIFGQARLFAMQQYRDFLGREGDASGIAHWTGQIDAGAQSRAQMVETFFNSAEFQGQGAPVVRLYFAYLLRIPDYDGLNFWIGQFRGGQSLVAVSDAFAGSPEFVNRYGALTNAQFIDRVYQNVLGRPADAPGLAHWTGQLNAGMTRGQLMVAFSESAEYRGLISNEVYVTMMYSGMLRRAPDASGFSHWVGYMDAGNSGLALVNPFLSSEEYRGRFGP